MKRSDVCRIVLFAGWLIAFGVLGIVGSLQLHAAPPPPCNACTCKNAYAYQAVGENPAGPKLAWKQLTDGTWEVTTHAFTAMLTKNDCDTGTATETTSPLAWTNFTDPSTICTYTIPPGQTVLMEVARPSSDGDSPNVVSTALKRWVCAP